MDEFMKKTSDAMERIFNFKIPLWKVSLAISIIEMVLLSVGLATCIATLMIPSERWVSLYRDHSLGFVSNPELQHQKDFDQIVTWIAPIGIVVTICRLVTCHFLLIGTLIEWPFLVATYIIASVVGLVGLIVTPLAMFMMSSQRELSFSENKDFHGKTSPFIIFGFFVQVGFLLIVTYHLIVMNHRRQT